MLRTVVAGFAAGLVLASISAFCAEGGAGGGSGYDGPKEKLHVYLLIGDVNMSGRAEFMQEDGGAIPRCYLLNGEDKWEPAENPLNRHSSLVKLLGLEGLNPGYTFSKTMLASDASVSIGLVVNAIGERRGTTIGQWVKGTPCYEDAVKRAKAAGATGTLKGILWHQGEAETDASYVEKLKVLIADLRRDLGVPELPFVAGQLSETAKNGKPMNDQIAKLPELVPFTGVAASEGCKATTGTWFNTAGMKLLGQRYAEAMLKIQGKPNAGNVRPPEVKPENPSPKPETGSGYAGPKEKLHVYLLIGQSNMSGRAEYTKEDARAIERCYLLNSEGRWEPARVPLNRYSTLNSGKPLNAERLSPGYGFAKAMLEKDPSISIGLISNARGSTFIQAWRSGYYKEVMKRVKVAQESGVFKGILWHQGESDNKHAGYLEELKAMIEAYRKDLGDPRLPFVAGEILNYGGVGKLINDQLAQLPAQVPFTGVASAEGLTGTKHVQINTDNVHFDMESMKTLGRRYAEAMLEIQAKIK